ncbi:tRNA preQ1(34) S-adenosylmethionine ribosyltransferase-isomerase QueA [Methylocella tundrae]|jgi:S-adenosylmethionine:tRNA ribosyltransferase-isomerase|uniref:S-adenosylmethionine:tRNA ribosyltransferase-isomerase n=1 Tax=Methylocella tundrae TaxID=227605 RepID=A0A4V6IMI6_METTU|nr:tRNA preQ1(34) S-adenosylmethionine ribosyltransferase-isomerase QueA [Methylocella tundrae]WPP06036.1 tRNA preQ1(34) S-adenosylmethionine ribosyltransferase-isomerase QueA [Methylocella tundrae]VFU08620.1 S-adenosylmethionine:tRNA ribosyltransferase-isomerase [Methylocella tundrae]
MRVDLFDFELPDSSIALRPAHPRDAARMLVVRSEAPSAPALEDRIIRDLPDLLSPGDILVVNDTRVIPARLQGRRVRGEAEARIEATLHKREGASLWRAFVRPAKKLKAGEMITFEAAGAGSLEAEVVEKGEEGEVLLGFAASGSDLDAALDRIGQMPLPPYISGKRPADESDADDYQTLFARRSGAVAAPTASLHFTPALIAALSARDIMIEKVTLHVGAGTFLPVKAADTEDHRMHAEWGEVSAQTAKTLNDARRGGRRIVAAGTTSLRILESAAKDNGAVAAFSGDTSIFITPGYRFRAVDVLLTNFHLPRSTLFMLVCAFCGLETMQRAYAHAIAHGYRFYSYGDACLLFPAAANKAGDL